MTRIVMTQFICGAVAVAMNFSAPAQAQNAVISDLKGKIFDVKMAQETFAGGLKHCGELDGTNFYFRPRDRVLNLDEYHRSLESLAMQRVFNPTTKKPWSQEDANARLGSTQAGGRRQSQLRAGREPARAPEKARSIAAAGRGAKVTKNNE
jgi:hypothetical protein